MDDWDVFFDPADFGQSAAWDTQAGDFVNLDGIFEEAREVALSGDTVGASAVLPVLTVATSQVPATAAQGDDLEINSVNYRVTDIQPDGSGLTRVVLERT
ncbi:head-tail joining protein [Ruegeria atlantica]|uniref:head-tail joining protein n=1 Tax=Ruegeria atlantica TaxID=81569 RepID=UPI0014818833|nr:hypothetical protein [Ruegeria atlantica]